MWRILGRISGSLVSMTYTRWHLETIMCIRNKVNVDQDKRLHQRNNSKKHVDAAPKGSGVVNAEGTSGFQQNVCEAFKSRTRITDWQSQLWLSIRYTTSLKTDEDSYRRKNSIVTVKQSAVAVKLTARLFVTVYRIFYDEGRRWSGNLSLHCILDVLLLSWTRLCYQSRVKIQCWEWRLPNWDFLQYKTAHNNARRFGCDRNVVLGLLWVINGHALGSLVVVGWYHQVVFGRVEVSTITKEKKAKKKVKNCKKENYQ